MNCQIPRYDVSYSELLPFFKKKRFLDPVVQQIVFFARFIRKLSGCVVYDGRSFLWPGHYNACQLCRGFESCCQNLCEERPCRGHRLWCYDARMRSTDKQHGPSVRWIYPNARVSMVRSHTRTPCGARQPLSLSNFFLLLMRNSTYTCT